MKALQRAGLIAITVLLATLLVACGSTPNQGSTANATNQATTNNQNQGNGTTMVTATPGAPMVTATPMNNGNMTGITITTNMGGNMAALIHTGKATIDGKMVDVLLTNKDFALYYYKPDAMFTATCTGQCAQDWPPVLAPQGMMISSSMPLPKQLSMRQTPNGAQVFYDGHALYTYAADKQPGNATGRGQDMQWYLVGFQL